MKKYKFYKIWGGKIHILKEYERYRCGIEKVREDEFLSTPPDLFRTDLCKRCFKSANLLEKALPDDLFEI